MNQNPNAAEDTQLGRAIVGTVVRQLMAKAGGALVAYGYVSGDTVEGYGGGLTLFAIALAWGVVQKYRVVELVHTALKMDADSSFDELRELLRGHFGGDHG